MTTYPLLHILLYLSLLFAPADAKKITITGPDSALLWELKRDDRGWQIQPRPGLLAGFDGRDAYASISPGHVILKGAGWQDDKDVQPFVAVAQAGHDWAKEAVLQLTATTSLEKDGSGFAFLLNRGDRGEKTYRIAYDPAAPTVAVTPPGHETRPRVSINPARLTSPFTFNVLGQVKNPGIYTLPPGSMLVDALSAAGGWVRQADLRKVTLLRGPAGTIPKRSIYNVQEILDGKGTAPSLEDRDTVYVGEKID